MDAQELRNLQEAYMEVYQELDEAKSDEGLSRDEKERVRAERQGGRDRISRGMRNDVMRGKKREKGVKSSYDSLGNMNRTRYRQQQFKRTGNPLYSEEFDLYDIILSYLLDEGYAETPEAAEAIMVNMSEDWRESIVEAKSDEGLSPDEKRAARSERGTVGYMHPLTRGDKKKKGRKDLSSTGIHGKYSQMQHIKQQNQRGRDADEQRRRNRDGMSRGTWDRD